MGVPHRQFDGGVAHQFLVELARDTAHGEVAVVGVAEVMPAEAALCVSDGRLRQAALQRSPHQPIGQGLPVLMPDNRTEPHPLRSADETTTEPGPGALRLPRR